MWCDSGSNYIDDIDDEEEEDTNVIGLKKKRLHQMSWVLLRNVEGSCCHYGH